MELKRTLRHRSLLVGAAVLGGATLVVTGAVGFSAASAAVGDPSMMPPATPPPGDSPDTSTKPKPGDDDQSRPKPGLDDLDEFGTFGGHRKPRPNMPAAGTGAGTPDDEAAANAAVAAAAAARAARPKSNIDMSDAMRAERCANNRARIAELEGQLVEINNAEASLHSAEERSGQLYADLPASSAEYVLVRAEVKSLKAAVAPGPDLRSQLAWHKNNLIALGC